MSPRRQRHETHTRPAIENTPTGRIGGFRAYCATCPWRGRTRRGKKQAADEGTEHEETA